MNPDRKVAVLHYLNNLSSTYSGFENTCIFPQRLLTLVDSENFGGNIVDVSSIIRTDDADKYAWYISNLSYVLHFIAYFLCAIMIILNVKKKKRNTL